LLQFKDTYADGQYESGYCLHDGVGVPVDLKGAAYQFKLAADQGLTAAEYHYGICLQDGDGVQIDLKGAAHYFKRAADQTVSFAQFKYGLYLENGEKITRNFQLARR
jgi:TPR repeat protein